MSADDGGVSFILDSPLGELEIGIIDSALASLRYLEASAVPVTGGRGKRFTRRTTSELMREVEYQLRRYFEDPQWHFDLPLSLCGTAFQRRVWKMLGRIPPGKVVTYGEVARRIDSGARAVGGACRSNPLPIVIPCHRVVSAVDVGGYCGNMKGAMRDAKQWLLQHELRNEGQKTGR